jgi:telomerase Cajal body protein 1
MAEEDEDVNAHLACKLLATAQAATARRQDPLVNNYFKSAKWSPDGTCVITNSCDNHIRTFIIPPTLLDDRDDALLLNTYSCITSFEPVNAFVCYPNYDLQDPATALVLSTASEHPIRLNSTLDARLVASYPLISSTTEAYIKPQSLLFVPGGGRFIAGANSMISTFDVSRTGQRPLTSKKMGPNKARSAWSNPATSLRGLISALDIDPQYNVLAAGSLNRQVGLYDSAGEGDCIGVFSLAGNEADDMISGSGITQVRWSRCGRYLYVTERRSDGAMVYDIRKTGQLLSWITGRNARTNQRMDVELAADHSQSVLAGGTDGTMRCWRAPYLQQGAVEPCWQSPLHSDAHLSSTSLHPYVSVLVTAAGHRGYGVQDLGLDLGADRTVKDSNMLMLWNLDGFGDRK